TRRAACRENPGTRTPGTANRRTKRPARPPRRATARRPDISIRAAAKEAVRTARVERNSCALTYVLRSIPQLRRRSRNVAVARLCGLSLRLAHRRKIALRVGVVGLERQRLLEPLGGLSELALAHERDADVVVRVGIVG